MSLSRYFRLLLPLLLLVTAGCVKAQPACQDFLAALGDKPAFIQFLGCEQETDSQGRPFTASYRVNGSEAGAAEKYLQSTFGMNRLERHCCVWESGPGFYRDEKTGIGYALSMASEETTVSDRASWDELPFFYITVSAYAEDP